MSKEFLSEYTDRSEPEFLAERTVLTCPKCGLSISGVMGYVCTRSGCPTGLGGSSVMNQELEG